MLMIFSVNIYVIIYVIKMSDDEAVDIAVAVANVSRIYFWRNYRNLENLIKILVATAVSVDLKLRIIVYNSSLT